MPGPTTGSIRLVPNVVAGTTKVGARVVQAAKAGPLVGVTAANNLHSLKYYVISIQLCQNLQLSGSGYSNPEGCIDLYQAGPGPSYDTYMVTQAKDDTMAGRYIDLMSAEGQAALRRPVTVQLPLAGLPDGGVDAGDGGDNDGGADGGAPDADEPEAGAPPPPNQAGVYRFGLINFYRPIKVKAEFPILGMPGQYFRTRAVTRINPTAGLGGGLGGERVEIGDTLSGTTEETTYMLNNGGALFTFQKPFVITRADLEAQTEIKIDLVFNPDSFGQAYQSQNCRDQQYVAICDPTNDVAIDMPFVRMNPVPRKAGEKTRKETYLMDYDTGSKLRIELYYNDGDPEAGIQGVDTAVVYTGANAQPVNKIVASNFVSQSGSVRSNNARVTLQDYLHMPNLRNLMRRQNGTATIDCVFTGAICPMAGGSVTRPYTYVGDTVVSSD